MKAKIKARWWSKDLQEKFGEFGSVHDLPDDKVPAERIE